jgi:hypothetical protein
MHACIYIYTHTYTPYIHIYIYIYKHTHSYRAYAGMKTLQAKREKPRNDALVYASMHMQCWYMYYVCMYASMHMQCLYIYVRMLYACMQKCVHREENPSKRWLETKDIPCVTARAHMCTVATVWYVYMHECMICMHVNSVSIPEVRNTPKYVGPRIECTLKCVQFKDILQSTWIS